MKVILALDGDEAGQRATLSHAESIADFTMSWGTPRHGGPTAQALAAAQLARDSASQRWAALDAAIEADPVETLIHARNDAHAVLEAIGVHITDLYRALHTDRNYVKAETAEEFELLEQPPPPLMYDATRIDWQGIKNRVDLVDWLTNVTGNTFVQRGATFKGTCPLPSHTEKTASFFIYPEKRNVYCFGCNFFGDIFDLAKELGVNVRDL